MYLRQSFSRSHNKQRRFEKIGELISYSQPLTSSAVATKFYSAADKPTVNQLSAASTVSCSYKFVFSRCYHRHFYVEFWRMLFCRNNNNMKLFPVDYDYVKNLRYSTSKIGQLNNLCKIILNVFVLQNNNNHNLHSSFLISRFKTRKKNSILFFKQGYHYPGPVFSHLL